MNNELTTIDIVTSAYNEEDCLLELFKRIANVMASESKYSFRIIIIDNGSNDKTWQIITNHSLANKRILGIRMSRNFILDAALTCGLDQATAEIAIVMCSDLQDPPEAIPLLLRKYEEGYDQVLAKIVSRKSVPFMRRILSKVFYKTANFMTNNMLPESVSDFRLVTNRTYRAIRSLRENHRFLRGLGAWVGFKTAQIEIDRPNRFAGESKWLSISLFEAITIASRSILAYSAKPLILISAFGFILSGLSILLIAIFSTVWIFGSVPFAGFGTIVGLISLGFSIIMLSIGIIAQYLGLIYEEVKQRPLYIISETTL